MDLYAERYEVRETARRNLYTGKTYNSVENIRQFFAERGMPAPQGLRRRSRQRRSAQRNRQRPKPPVKPKKKIGPGSTIEHAKYGRGTVCGWKARAKIRR